MANKSLGGCVLDTNSLVSAFLFPESLPGQVLDTVLANGRLLTSLETAAELALVLRRSKFDRYLTAKRREELAAATIAASEMIEVVSSVRECRDANDDKFLELALDGNAESIVTGDSDLLALHPWRGIKILTPHAALGYFASLS